MCTLTSFLYLLETDLNIGIQDKIKLYQLENRICSLGEGSIPGWSNTQRLKISGRKCYTHPTVQTFGSFEWDLKKRGPCFGSYPQACKRSQTVCWKSRELPRLYWTSQFFSSGKHLMANKLCAILVKCTKFKKIIVHSWNVFISLFW